MNQLEAIFLTHFHADHPPIEPNFEYTIEYKGRKVVISADTIVIDNLIKHIGSEDLLVGNATNKEAIEIIEKGMLRMGRYLYGNYYG